MIVNVKPVEGCTNPLPQYQTKGAAGMDLLAFLDGVDIIGPGERLAVSTGLMFEIPRGWEMQIRSRSGLALKNGIYVLNSPATIDSDYRGEVKVILANFSDTSFKIKNGDRIAQAVFAPVTQAMLVPVNFLSETERGDGGFGSSGV